MSTSVAARPAAPPPSGSAGPTGPAPQTAPAKVKEPRSTPSILRLLLALAVVASVVFGFAGFQTGMSQAGAVSDASAEAGQLLGIQNVRNDLVRADALAANAFLVGGLEPSEQRAEYDATIADALETLTTLSASGRGGKDSIARVTADIAVYTGLVEQARANNRQGFPVGSGYLSQASALLNDSTLPALEALVVASADSAAGSFAATSASLAWLLLAALALVALVSVHLWITRRSHRYLNWPLLGAIALVFLAGLVGVVTFSGTATKANDARSNSYSKTLAVSQAYTAATEAKSLESFTLIKRGSGQALEEQAQESIDEARAHLDTGSEPYLIPTILSDGFETWATLHDGIRAADDSGDWEGAVKLATTTTAEGANAAFEAFSAIAEGQIDDSAAATKATFDDRRVLSTVLAWILLAAGFAAAALSWRGVSLRLKEYR